MLQKQREYITSIVDLNNATQKRRDDILAGTVQGQRFGRDPVAEAIDRVNRRATAIAGTSNSDQLSQRREAALRRSAEIAEQIKSDPGSAPGLESERIALADEIQKTTQALELLGKETEVYTAILEKAGAVGKTLGSLEDGLSTLLDDVASGNIGGIQQAFGEQASIARVVRGVAFSKIAV